MEWGPGLLDPLSLLLLLLLMSFCCYVVEGEVDLAQ